MSDSPAGSASCTVARKPAAATAPSRSLSTTGCIAAGRLLVDDIVSSGGTLIACAEALIAAGATHRCRRHSRCFPPEIVPEYHHVRHSSIRSPPQRAAFHQASRSTIFVDALLNLQHPGDTMSVTLRFCGAARTVTGSCYLFETRAGRCWSTAGCFRGRRR